MRHVAKYLLVVCVLAILAAGGFVFWYIQNITHMEAMCGGPKGEYGAEFTAWVNEFDAIQARALQQQDANICGEIQEFFCGSLRRQQCFVAVAVATNDTKICREKMGGRHLEERINLDWCYEEVAMKYNDVSICDALGTVYSERAGQPGYHLWPAIQARCYYRVVQITKDTFSCDRLSAEDGKTLCRLKLSDDPAYCAKITDSLIRMMCESYLREGSGSSSE